MKPMLAATCEDVTTLSYPLYASAKLDGVRAIVTKDGKLLSRSLKPIPNPHVNKLFGRKEFAGMDGELILGDPRAKDVYRQTIGAVSREYDEPDVQFYVFDSWMRTVSFMEWHHSTKLFHKTITRVAQSQVRTAEELLRLEEEYLDEGYEGLILRHPDGKYKFGRSTLREQGMLKLKRFSDSEAEIFGMAEENENTNEAKKNALGRTERSTAQEGMVGKDRMGKLAAKDIHTGVWFGLGGGFTHEMREFLWKMRTKKEVQFPTGVDGRMETYFAVKKPWIEKYKFFAVGVKERPRFPVSLGPREAWDL